MSHASGAWYPCSPPVRMLRDKPGQPVEADVLVLVVQRQAGNRCLRVEVLQSVRREQLAADEVQRRVPCAPLVRGLVTVACELLIQRPGKCLFEVMPDAGGCDQ